LVQKHLRSKVSARSRLRVTAGKIVRIALGHEHKIRVNDSKSTIFSSVCGWFTDGFDMLDLRNAKALLDELVFPSWSSISCGLSRASNSANSRAFTSDGILGSASARAIASSEFGKIAR